MSNDEFYKGYKIIEGNTNYITEQLSNTKDGNWLTNEYALIKNIDTGETSEMRFDGDKFVSLKLPSSKYIKGKNALQRCAIDLLANDEITIAAILGCYGSGKSWLSMRMALWHIQENTKATKNFF